MTSFENLKEGREGSCGISWDKAYSFPRVCHFKVQFQSHRSDQLCPRRGVRSYRTEARKVYYLVNIQPRNRCFGLTIMTKHLFSATRLTKAPGSLPTALLRTQATPHWISFARRSLEGFLSRNVQLLFRNDPVVRFGSISNPAYGFVFQIKA